MANYLRISDNIYLKKPFTKLTEEQLKNLKHGTLIEFEIFDNLTQRSMTQIEYYDNKFI